MLGSRAIWANGWTAVTWHEKGKDWADDKWELYNTDANFSQAHDLADQLAGGSEEVPFAFTGKLDNVTIDMGADQTSKTKTMIAPEKDRHFDFD